MSDKGSVGYCHQLFTWRISGLILNFFLLGVRDINIMLCFCLSSFNLAGSEMKGREPCFTFC